jgi:UDP-N-acetylmuramate dehydrogenase
MMMAAEAQPPSLIEQLPPVRGRLSENVALSGITWFRVGGPAEVMFRPADCDDLADFLRQRPPEVPLTVIGVGSNLLVRDGGVPGLVLRLGRGFARITCRQQRIRVGAAALDANVALTAKLAGLSGLEFLSGIPGTIGGALRMNAGAYGREIKDVLVEAEAIDPQGQAHLLSPADLDFGYRRSGLPEDWIVTAAVLAGEPAEPETVAHRMAAIRQAREASQPVRSRTGGSTFRNPQGAQGPKAWELIDQAGCRGLRRGGAMVSEQHCNFLINTGRATAADLESLGEEVRRRVAAETGIELHWEIRRIGRHRELPT